MTARSLEEHLATAEGMAKLAAHANRLLQLQHRLEAALPANLRAHARVANFRLGKLFIHAANGAVAAKVRQLGPRLADDLSNKAVKVTQIEVRVQAQNPGQPRQERKIPAPPGEKQQQALTSLARSLPETSTLKGALERLLHSVKER